MKPPLPPDESARLAALRRYEILDTPGDQDFDDLTLLAAQICQVPTAMISFVDEKRQWFKSRVGLSAAETARDIAFCAYTILDSDQVMEVRDAEADQRFAASPLVTQEPHIRFYAGAPLVAPDGQALGALCVMDQKPRSLTPEQVAALRVLSRHAMTRLETRRQARELAELAAERERTEARLQRKNEELAASERDSARLLAVAEKSRRALLSLIEDEQLAGRKLRESEERFRQLAENINEVFWMTDPDKHTMLYVSPAYEAIWGRSCESLMAHPMNWLDAIHPEDRARIIQAARDKQSRGDYDEVYRIKRPDGAERWIHDRAFPVRDAEGRVFRMVGTAEDITVRKRAETRAAVQHAIVGVLAEGGGNLNDMARRILEIVCRRLEWEVGDLWRVDGTTKMLRCAEIWHPLSTEFRAFAETSLALVLAPGEGLPGLVWRGKEPMWLSDVTQENAFRRRAEAAAIGLRGALAFPIKLRNEVFGVVEFFSTRSLPPDEELLAMFAAVGTQIGQYIERQQLEAQFRQAQKMEAIGTLAGGIAHDFNNVLSAIMGYTELARMESQGNAEVSEYLKAVQDGGRRATDLVRQILAFSRLQEHQRKAIQLWPVVEEALKLLRATIPTTVQFEVTLLRRGPTVLADPTQIHQVLMNLATNAAHAMRERGGRLGVTVEAIDVDTELAALHPGLRPGPYMRIGVSDTGHGMDEATLARIFDPFYTTKAPGEGTGLGLAVVHGIVQSHDGAITVYSRPGEGTRFHLYFPAHGIDLTEAGAQLDSTPLGLGERIMVVDDEAPLALMAKKMLQRLSYIVESHSLPGDAEAAFRAAPGNYDLLLTDYTMPGMSGIELAKRVAAIRPDLPIILTTGYSATLTTERIRAMGIREMLLKPLTVHSLGEAVHRVLAEVKSKPADNSLSP